MNTIPQNLPVVHIHCCAACSRPHHWLTGVCQDTHCPWIHHRGSYGNILATLGQCDCTLIAIETHLVEIFPLHRAIASRIVRMPGLALCSLNGTPYQPTADEWLHIIGAIVDEQRSGFGDPRGWEEAMTMLRKGAAV